MHKLINFVYILQQTCKSLVKPHSFECESCAPFHFRWLRLYTHVRILYARSLLERDKGTRGVTHGLEDRFNIRVGGSRTADGYGKKP